MRFEQKVHDTKKKKKSINESFSHISAFILCRLVLAVMMNYSHLNVFYEMLRIHEPQQRKKKGIFQHTKNKMWFISSANSLNTI